MRKVVLTGAGGFLGSHLLGEYIKHGFSVCAVSSKSQDQLLSNVRYGDLGRSLVEVIARDDWDRLASAMSDADILVSCAFPRSADGFQLARGMEYTAKIFRIANESGVGSIVNISSQSVYSQSRNEPADEKSRLCLESAYAVAKYTSELLLDAVSSDIPRTNIRLGSLIGPEFEQRFVNKMSRMALDGKSLRALENGSRFGFLDVRDAVDALICVSASDCMTWKPVYVVGGDNGYSLTEVAEAIVELVHELTGQEIDLATEHSTVPPVVSSCCNRCFEDDFAWSRKYTLRDSIRYILMFYLG